MIKITHPQATPYGGTYKLNLPEMGTVGEGRDFNHLVRSVADHRRANALPVGLGLADEVERECCKAYPDMCMDKDPNLPTVKRLSWSGVLRGTTVLSSLIASGDPLVPRDEAIRRAKICSECRYCVEFSKPCGGICGPLLTAVKALIGSASTPYDKGKSCGICECYADAHVWVPMEHLDKGLTDTMRAQFANISWCWKKSPATNQGAS
jgi:hypothetical protein